jgi:hypothetical protein
MRQGGARAGLLATALARRLAVALLRSLQPSGPASRPGL